jgi:glycosyltransferase involved in cell wall biosynthesis
MSSKQPLKATNVALQAIQYSLKHQPDLKVRACGRDHPAPGLPLPPDFDFAQKPPQAQIASIYASCDAFLWPSLREGFGLPILEAMACRTPVISTRTGIAPDIIEDGVNGYLVDPNDPHAIADRVQRVAELSDNAWRTMSDAAFAQVNSYSWDDAANLFEQSLIQTAAASPAKNK